MTKYEPVVCHSVSLKVCFTFIFEKEETIEKKYSMPVSFFLSKGNLFDFSSFILVSTRPIF